MNKILKIFISCNLLPLLVMFGSSVYAEDHQTLQLADGSEINAEVYGTSSTVRVLWVGPSYGIKPRHRQVANDLGKLGLEVWLVDLADSLFLPRGANTMRTIPASIVSELIEQLTLEQHKLLIISGSYGSIPALRGAQQWQAQQPKQASVLGIILFSPYLYTTVPTLGKAPDLVPIQTSIPTYIFQAEKNGNRWYFPTQLAHIQKHAPVYSEIMPGVISMFYDEDDSESTRTVLKNIAARIKQRMPLLSKHKYPLTAPAVHIDTAPRLGIDDKLKTYRGTVQPTAFSLRDVHGNLLQRDHFKGKVTIINFWATWCPPCVEEIPSLNRLREKMTGQPFELISINYAESPEKIREFMKTVAVDFPVLVDPEGKLSRQWKVVAFPSTFVIGPDGKIHYGVNAAIHWDTPAIISALEKLLR